MNGEISGFHDLCINHIIMLDLLPPYFCKYGDGGKYGDPGVPKIRGPHIYMTRLPIPWPTSDGPLSSADLPSANRLWSKSPSLVEMD